MRLIRHFNGIAKVKAAVYGLMTKWLMPVLIKMAEIITQDANVNELSALVDMLHRTGGILGDVAGHHILGEFIMGFRCIFIFCCLSVWGDFFIAYIN